MRFETDSRIQALTLRQLRLVELLGEVQSVQVAASILGITQSSATKSLQKVETLFDTLLFNRTSKGLLPTRAGLAVIGHAGSIMRSIQRADWEVQNIKDGRKGELRIGAPNGASRAALQKAIVRHSQKYSDISINVKEASSVDLHTMLIGRELDCIIGRRARPSDIPGVTFDAIYTEILCLCVSPQHPMASQPNVRLADLEANSWILPPTEMRARQAIDASFSDAGLPAPTRFIETVGPQGKQLLLDSNMVGIWPYQAIRREYLAGQISILNIALPRTITQIGLSLLTLDDHPQFFQDFCTAVRDAGAEINANQSEWRALFSM